MAGDAAREPVRDAARDIVRLSAERDGDKEYEPLQTRKVNFVGRKKESGHSLIKIINRYEEE